MRNLIKNKQIHKHLLFGLVLAVTFLFALSSMTGLGAGTASAILQAPDPPPPANTGIVDTSHLPKAQANQASINSVLAIVFAITGSLSLLMIVLGGFRYITAQGDPSAVAKARNAIMYAVIGLVISLAAFTIVAFVVGKVG